MIYKLTYIMQAGTQEEKSHHCMIRRKRSRNTGGNCKFPNGQMYRRHHLQITQRRVEFDNLTERSVIAHRRDAENRTCEMSPPYTNTKPIQDHFHHHLPCMYQIHSTKEIQNIISSIKVKRHGAYDTIHGSALSPGGIITRLREVSQYSKVTTLQIHLAH